MGQAFRRRVYVFSAINLLLLEPFFFLFDFFLYGRSEPGDYVLSIGDSRPSPLDFSCGLRRVRFVESEISKLSQILS